ncbi:hypothetical protein KP509_31G044700 [Ceratopteris richardii]|nr:hypothetical protein KP509_31G044700 [Ceratopteris richardii]
MATHIVRMFSVCGSISEATQTFVRLDFPNVYTWSAFLLAHSCTGLSVPLYHKMLQSNVRPNAYCYTALLKACANLGSLNKGMLVHDNIVQDGLDLDLTVNNTLIDMYVKIGELANAHSVFQSSHVQNVVTWTTIITGYSVNECAFKAFQVYAQMLEKHVSPNEVTFVSIIKACPSALEVRLVHFHVVESSLAWNIFVGNALVGIYAEFGNIEDARFVFEHLIEKDVVTWSSMIEGYAQEGQVSEAFRLFTVMWQEVEPNKVTYVNLAKACTNMESVASSNLIYGTVIEEGFNSDTLLGTTMIDLYAKCGCFEDANALFKALPVRNVVTWTTMISGYALHGNIHGALKCYSGMQEEGLKPNEATFLSLLSLCNHLGLVHKGCTFFESMVLQGVIPAVEHHHCIMDLFGRTGSLKLATVVLDSSPVTPMQSPGLRSLLSHCKAHCNVGTSELIFKQVALEE